MDSTRQELSNYLGVNKRTVERWLSNYRAHGIEELLTEQPRRQGSAIITKEIHDGLEARVNDPKNSFKGYWDAYRWLVSEYGVTVKYHWLRKYMISRFGTKVKRPRKLHVKKDEQAVAFKKKLSEEPKRIVKVIHMFKSINMYF